MFITENTTSIYTQPSHLIITEFIQGEDLCATLGMIFLWLVVPFSTMVGMVAMSKEDMAAMSKKRAEKEAGIQHVVNVGLCPIHPYY